MDQDSEPKKTYLIDSASAYNKIEVVGRGVNYIVDSASEFDVDIKESIFGLGRVKAPVRIKKLTKVLNHQPNPYVDIDAFRRNIYMDLLLNGNAYLYWDGSFLYNIPAEGMVIVKDSQTFVNHYVYLDKVKYSVDEIIHIRENSSTSIYAGTSRLESAKTSISALSNMQEFHDNFFKNGAIPGLILKTPDTLSKRIKDKKILEWMQNYNPKTGGRKPVIVDGGMDIDTLSTRDLRELDFQESIKTHELKIAKALGVPPVLMESGNNANISPNVRLFYTGTVMPLVNKVVKALENFFGYDLDLVTQNIVALRPELRDEAAYFSTLTNGGIMTINEAREKLRLEKSEDPIADQLIKPANVAGSAADPTTGGKPTQADPK